MIIVEIKVPALDKIYDFQLEENVPLKDVRREIGEIICRKEQLPLRGDVNKLLMWDANEKRQLILEETAYENGLKTGDCILLV